MKRVLNLLLALPLLAFFTACNDDKDVPQVSLSIEYTGATSEDGVLYVVQGEPLTITSLVAVPDEGTQAAAVTTATYYWDGAPFERTVFSPFSVTIDTEGIPVGPHTLGVYADVAQVDKSLGFAVANFPVVIVEKPEEQPGEPLPQ